MDYDPDIEDIPYEEDEEGYQEELSALDLAARNGLLELIEREHAVLWPEVEAKLSDRPQPAPAVKGINPHLLTSARRTLLAEGVIEPTVDATKGGGHVTVYGLKNRRGVKTKFERAAMKKRPLQARYISWSGNTAVIPNLIGEGGEIVVRSALKQMAQLGICTPVGGAVSDVTTIFRDQPVAGGSLDAAAHYLVEDLRTDNMRTITTVIEVKNLRDHLYPSSHEIFQLLDKAARLQVAWPNRSFLPVLVCRRAQYLTFVMAKHLGFFVVQFGTQGTEWVQPLRRHNRVTEADILEVREALGYQVALMEKPNRHILEQFQTAIPRQSLTASTRWALTAPILADHYVALRNESLTPEQRALAVDHLYRDACQIVLPQKPWRSRTVNRRVGVPF